ncbi:hypothetical protein RFI_13678 [Reticulomyxa filosa]|uniref:Alcohol dehydrogenase-like N-terminal domain-containing protein n=1 Tax=Reticulomyxa filosa TaxID=46433 RepID=X6NB39_RETFI|nr:hypothetical protein RFI_13678 [Reticulomyxa filosa]|eukprot:ETO23500.1 hypothetical protein RFI_13678 [Reticulomyxa filosa]
MVKDLENECCNEINRLNFLQKKKKNVGPKTKMKIGTRVAIEDHFYCGGCVQCKEKRGDICQNLSLFGHGVRTSDGGCCEYFIVKENYCYRLRSNISWNEAVLLEPLGVAYNAVEQAEVLFVDVLEQFEQRGRGKGKEKKMSKKKKKKKGGEEEERQSFLKSYRHTFFCFKLFFDSTFSQKKKKKFFI